MKKDYFYTILLTFLLGLIGFYLGTNYIMQESNKKANIVCFVIGIILQLMLVYFISFNS